MRLRQPAVYLLASQRNGTLYVGVSSNLVQRAWQHRTHAAPGFTERYGVERLVWYELHASMEEAIRRENQIKKRQRAWKVRMIEAGNPCWMDLWETIL